MKNRIIEYSGQFKKDFKKLKKRNKDIKKLKILIDLLVNNLQIPKKYKDYPLQGNYKDYRDLHIEPDWILIYKINDKLLRFERIGTHSDLF